MQDFSACAKGNADGGGAGAADLISGATAKASNDRKMTAPKIKTSGWLRPALCVIMAITLERLLQPSEKNS